MRTTFTIFHSPIVSSFFSPCCGGASGGGREGEGEGVVVVNELAAEVEGEGWGCLAHSSETWLHY